MRSPLDNQRWYYANTSSPAVPEGLGDEEAICAIWAADLIFMLALSRRDFLDSFRYSVA